MKLFAKTLVIAALTMIAVAAHAEQSCEGIDVFEKQYSEAEGAKTKLVSNSKVAALMPSIIKRAALMNGVICLPKDLLNYNELEAATFSLQYGARNLDNNQLIDATKLRERMDQSERKLHQTVAAMKAFAAPSLRLAELKKDISLFVALRKGDKDVQMRCETGFVKAEDGSSESQHENTDAVRCYATKTTQLKGRATRRDEQILIFSVRDYVKGGIVIHSLKADSYEDSGEGCGCSE